MWAWQNKGNQNQDNRSHRTCPQNRQGKLILNIGLGYGINTFVVGENGEDSQGDCEAEPDNRTKDISASSFIV